MYDNINGFGKYASIDGKIIETYANKNNYANDLKGGKYA